jgi:hypothetical protein
VASEQFDSPNKSSSSSPPGTNICEVNFAVFLICVNNLPFVLELIAAPLSAFILVQRKKVISISAIASRTASYSPLLR